MISHTMEPHSLTQLITMIGRIATLGGDSNQVCLSTHPELGWGISTWRGDLHAGEVRLISRDSMAEWARTPAFEWSEDIILALADWIYSEHANWI